MVLLWNIGFGWRTHAHSDSLGEGIPKICPIVVGHPQQFLNNRGILCGYILDFRWIIFEVK